MTTVAKTSTKRLERSLQTWALAGAMGHVPSLVKLVNALKISASLGNCALLKYLQPLKWLVYLVFILNVKSLPMVWHLRNTQPVICSYVQHWVLCARLRLSLSKSYSNKLEEEWIDSTPMIGVNPFEYRHTFHATATLDECDFNLHLSNSSYAKILDGARYEIILNMFPLIFRSGASMALGATHFHFIREIPPMHDFEIRSHIASWDRKWMYVVSKFVSKPKASAGKKKISSGAESAPDAASNTPPPASYLTEPDGSIVHAVAVGHLCFKAGRVTVPASLALASNGLCGPSGTVYSRENPPPHWAEVKKLTVPRLGGSLKNYFEFLKAGWKEVPEQERWWDTELCGEVEKQRADALVEFEKLHRGLEGARRTL